MLIGRIISSAAFRLRPALRWLGDNQILPNPKFREVPTFAMKLITLCGEAQLPMLRHSLTSISQSWHSFPETTTVVSDGSLSSRTIRAALDGIPTNLSVDTVGEYCRHQQMAGRHVLADFAKLHPWNAKLAVFVKESEQGRFLWCDTDVLFFDDLSARIASFRKGALIRACRDYMYCYDAHIQAQLPASLLDQPPVNAGFVLAEGISYDALDLEKHLFYSRDHWSAYTEQTILAFCLQQMQGSYWADDEMIITEDDSPEVLGNPASHGWRGRHYISPHRHLFWRDALMLQARRGLRPPVARTDTDRNRV